MIPPEEKGDSKRQPQVAVLKCVYLFSHQQKQNLWTVWYTKDVHVQNGPTSKAFLWESISAGGLNGSDPSSSQNAGWRIICGFPFFTWAILSLLIPILNLNLLWLDVQISGNCLTANQFLWKDSRTSRFGVCVMNTFWWALSCCCVKKNKKDLKGLDWVNLAIIFYLQPSVFQTVFHSASLFLAVFVQDHKAESMQNKLHKDLCHLLKNPSPEHFFMDDHE